MSKPNGPTINFGNIEFDGPFSTPKIGTLLNRDVDRNSNDFSSFKIVIEPKDDANERDIAIHKLLDSLDIFKINVKEYLQD